MNVPVAGTKLLLRVSSHWLGAVASGALLLAGVLMGCSAPSGDFGVSASPAAITLTAGGTGQARINVLAVKGFKGRVTFEIQEPEESPIRARFGTPDSAILYLSADTTARSGTYGFAVTARSRGLERTVPISVRIRHPAETFAVRVSTSREGRTLVTFSVVLPDPGAFALFQLGTVLGMGESHRASVSAAFPCYLPTGQKTVGDYGDNPHARTAGLFSGVRGGDIVSLTLLADSFTGDPFYVDVTCYEDFVIKVQRTAPTTFDTLSVLTEADLAEKKPLPAPWGTVILRAARSLGERVVSEKLDVLVRALDYSNKDWRRTEDAYPVRVWFGGQETLALDSLWKEAGRYLIVDVWFAVERVRIELLETLIREAILAMGSAILSSQLTAEGAPFRQLCIRTTGQAPPSARPSDMSILNWIFASQEREEYWFTVDEVVQAATVAPSPTPP